MTVHKIPIREAMRNVTLEVRLTGLKVARARLWLACQLIRLAALVGGFKADIEEPEA